MPDHARSPRYRRVLLKLSGEGLMGDRDYGLDPETVDRICEEIRGVHEMGVEVCLVIGAGNIFRGVSGAASGIERSTADHMGMLATVINALAVQSVLEGKGVETRVQSAIPMASVCESYIRRRAERHMEKGRVVLFAAGTGNPYFTTDTAAALRAAEMGCDALLKGTQVDGVYSADPKTDPDAKRYDELTYQTVLSENLKVMDTSAVALSRENNVPILVFSIHQPGSFADVVCGDGQFTIVRYIAARSTRTSRLRGQFTWEVPDVSDFNFAATKKDVQRRMDSAVDVLHKEFAGLRSGRATTSLLEPIHVDAYGSSMPMNQVGNIGVPEPRMLTVQVWDKALVTSVEKAIRDSDLGLNPQVDGQLVRVPIPALTEERRTEFVKVAGKYAEDARIAVRNVRRGAMDDLKKAEKDGNISEDEHRGHSDDIQKLTDDAVKRIDDRLSEKEQEIMQV